MIPVTVDSVSAWLLPYSAEWGSAPVSTFEILTEAEAGRSGREHRRAFSATLRTTLKFGSQLIADEAADLLAALEESTDNRPILVPFWPAAVPFAERSAAPVTGGLRVWFEADWSAYAISLDTAADPSGYSASALTAPLLWCRWVRRPDSELLTGAGDLELVFEAGDIGPAAYALSPQGGALGYGAIVGGVATPALSADLINWLRPTASTDITVERERIGYGRDQSEEFVEQLARRGQKLAVRCVGAGEIAQFIRLFLDRRGNAGSWWCPSFNDPASSLLVRFKSPKLQLTWATPTQADAQLEVIAVPTEESLPAGETRGTTIGDLGTKWWGYVVTDGDLTWRFTSFESDVAAGTLGTFESRPIDHGDITSELNLQRHDVDLTVGWFSGSPFERARLDRLAPPLTVRIYEGTLANPSASELVFTGKAAGYQFQGGKCTCKIAGPTALFDGRGPVAVTSPRCWTPMYSPLCGLSRAGLGVAVDLAAISGTTLSFVLPGLDYFVGSPADHYRYGYAERLLADGSRRRLPIVGSGETSTEGTESTMALSDYWPGAEPTPFSLGYRYTQLGASFLLLSTHDVVGTWDRWRINTAANPSAQRTSAAAAWGARGQSVEAGAVIVQPGTTWSGYTAARFTAPAAGSYYVRASTADAGYYAPHCVSAAVIVGGTNTVASAAIGSELNFAGMISLAEGGVVEVVLRAENDGDSNQTLVVFEVVGTDIGIGPLSVATARPVAAPAAYPESGWVIYPGCDHSWARCKALGNGSNFRGCPHFPKSNPAMVSVKQETASGSKK